MRTVENEVNLENESQTVNIKEYILTVMIGYTWSHYLLSCGLVGRGTPALKVLQTPSDTPFVKSRRRQKIWKRKIVMDMATILGAE